MNNTDNSAQQQTPSLQNPSAQKFSENLPVSEASNTKQRVSLMLIIGIVVMMVLVAGGAYYLGKTSKSPSDESKTPSIAVSPTPEEIIDIDSQSNPELGIAGYSSGSLLINGKEVTLRLLAPDREKVTISNFPCENKEVTAVKGTFKIIALEAPSYKKIIDRMDLGTLEFVMNPPEIEQTGRFSKTITLSQNPKYEAFTLVFRKSCFDTQVFFYSFNDKTNSVARISFVRKDGSSSDSILIPKGFSIPQIDDKGNIIASAYNDKTKERDKIRYNFNLEKFEFEELESYSQPK